MSEPTPVERFKALAKKVITMPKAEVDGQESAYRKRRTTKRPKKS